MAQFGISLRRSLSNIILIITMLLLLSKVLYGQLNSNEKTCAVLYSAPEAKGQRFLLTDWDQSIDLKEDLRVSQDGWKVTEYIVVETGCKLETCSETYLDGSCRTFQAGSHEFSSLIQPIQSACCSCAKQCNCTDVFITMSSCGRAYLNGGCSTCDASYIDLNGYNNYFPEEYADKVTAIKLRKGCTLTAYNDDGDDSDERVTESEIVEDFSARIGSYSCQCNESMYEPKPIPPRPANYQDFIPIPNSINDVINMMGTSAVHRNHSGLQSARTSYSNGRSLKNAYILLLGSSGAGKSSTINLLFGNESIIRVSDTHCVSQQIEEYRIPVPIDNLGIANSELRVIEIPGLGDTRGMEQDARTLAALDTFLSTHEELKDRLPNAIFIFHKFHDRHLDPKNGSYFISMLRGLDYFTKRITDENYSNVIFVLSHFFSETKRNRRNPEFRLNQFKEAIEDNTLFPKPIHLVVAENKATENELLMVNGYYKLPNNEYYPINLFTKMELITKNAGDMIGLEVFRAAFRDSENLNITRLPLKLKFNTNDRVEMFLKVLVFPNEQNLTSEVSDKLKEAWRRYVSSDLRRQFPGSLYYIQNALYLRNITTTNDVPKTEADVAYLLSTLKWDEAIKLLLDKGLNIKPPKFPMNIMVGYSYNIFRDTLSSVLTSPFKMSIRSSHLSNLGFLVPKAIRCTLDSHMKGHFNIFEDPQKYFEHRFKSLGVEETFSPELYQGTLKPGNNINDFSFSSDSCTLTAIHEVRRFEFVLDHNSELTSAFQRTVKALPPFNSTNYESVAQWRHFYNIYGTHVVQSAYGGGVIEFKLESDKPCNQSIIEGLHDLAKFGIEFNYLSTLAGEGIRYSLKFDGGDPAYHKNNFTGITMTEASNLLSNWKKSLKWNPVLLNTDMRLEAISQVISHVGLNYTNQAEIAAKHLFSPCSDYWITIIDSKQRQAKVEENMNARIENEIKFRIAQAESQIDAIAALKRQEDLEEMRRIHDEKMAQKQREFQLAQAESQIDAIAARKRQEDLEEKRRIHDEKMAQKQREFQLAQAESQRAAEKRNMELLQAIINRPAPDQQTCIIFGLACW